ncbi:MAG: SDR family oxidoreductase [Myxococcota bacterium]
MTETKEMPNFAGATVVVTGGAGFIGSHLVDGLLRAGAAEVRVLDNFETGHQKNLDHVRDRITVTEGDIRDLAVCQRVLEGAAYVFHQAALGSVPRSMAEPARSIDVNVGGTANIFQAARDAAVKRVVFASSSAVYGDDDRLPKREGQEGRPLSPYAVSKWMNEELADVYARGYEMALVGLRYFNVYGPRQDPNGPYAAVVPRFFDFASRGEDLTIYGDGEQSRDFTFVGDVVRANLLAAKSDLSGAWAFNIGAGGTTTVNDLANTINDVMGGRSKVVHLPERKGDIKHSLADTSRAREHFGYVATTVLADGLAKTKPQ